LFLIYKYQVAETFGARTESFRRANNGRAHGTLWRNYTTERWVSVDGELLQHHHLSGARAAAARAGRKQRARAVAQN